MVVDLVVAFLVLLLAGLCSHVPHDERTPCQGGAGGGLDVIGDDDVNMGDWSFAAAAAAEAADDDDGEQSESLQSFEYSILSI